MKLNCIEIYTLIIMLSTNPPLTPLSRLYLNVGTFIQIIKKLVIMFILEF